MTTEAKVALIKTALQAAFPQRLVTRSALDFAQRSAADRKRGVITLASNFIDQLQAPNAFFDVAGRLRLGLLFEFELSEKADGETVERAEWAFLEELRAFIRSPGDGLCPLSILSAEFSKQAVVPAGFLFADLEFSELD